MLDLDRARAFYAAIFGWEFDRPSAMNLPDEGTYLIFSKKGTAAHGGLQLVKPHELVAPKEKTQWAVRITMTVESVDASLAAAEKAGGEILEYVFVLLPYLFFCSREGRKEADNERYF